MATNVHLVSYNEEGDFVSEYDFTTRTKPTHTDKLSEEALEKFPELLQETSFTIEAYVGTNSETNYKLITRCGL